MTHLPLEQRFADRMGQLLGPEFPSDLGLAVSGGGDSMAMLTLAHNWTRSFGIRLWVVTVDHGLRDESAAEAAMVAEDCARLGWPHATLRWQWDGTGNVQDAARRARLALIDRWRGNLKHVLFAHTADDQAETVLMRLARGSGVDGLSGMRACREVTPHPLVPPLLAAGQMTGQAPPRDQACSGYRVLRPCLDMERAELRHYLSVLKGRWVDDPSNENRDFGRVRIRQLLNLLREEGVTTSVLSDTARRMARARDGLTAHLVEAVRRLCVDAPSGQLRIDRDGFAALDEETRLRLLTAGLQYVTAAEYRPRAASSEALLDQVLSGRGGTLHGAEVLVEKTHLRLLREESAVDGLSCGLDALWDGQWRLSDPDGLLPANAAVRALGEDGWRQIADRSGLALPFRAARALPSVWGDGMLLACPELQVGPSVGLHRYVLGRPDTGFEAFCLSH
ncbi:MAG: tRNA lysidine(34) synthetase TilS [Marivita sp.]|uniref:tRNA lysidine(34) synthetase TilS n=1 Tax=Marivita sp. TaxID=2003365 RepID=UPI0025BD2F61|nr:tRNA lysidine(34) synthetase TilS [Marivita sp.]MCI5108983.1 tRNA lysidine(34) synthetase TilS [Marivita sp.]